MLNIAIVEDDTQQAAQLESALKTYGSEYGVLLSVTTFHSALAFLGNLRDSAQLYRSVRVL